MASKPGQSFVVRVGSEQHIGSREGQEDCLAVSDFLGTKLPGIGSHSGLLGVLADGMGGFHGGKLASETAVKEFVETYNTKDPDEPVRDALMRALFAANDAVRSIQVSGIGEGKIGTTMVATAIRDSQLYWISVGDSRAYLIRGDNIVQLTTDHTYATELQRQVLKQSIQQSEADSHPDRDVLTSYVGVPDLTDIDCNIKAFELEPEDVIMLCSDGLYRTLTEDEIFEEVTGHPQEICAALIEKVVNKKNKVQDNVSVIMFSCAIETVDPTLAEKEYQDEWSSIDTTNRMIGVILLIMALLGLGWIYSTFFR